MKQLRSANPAKLAIIGNQRPEPGIKYIDNPCLIREGNAVFNPLTEEAILLDDLNKDRISLVRGWYLVPEDLDVRTISHAIRQKQLAAQSAPTAKTGYTIFTTTACNARCSYCFEKDYKVLTMSKDMSEKVAAYIVKTHSKREISLKWFGGEPLVNRDTIDLICKRLSERGIAFSSEMTTNGDLLPKCSDEDFQEWHLKGVQLTLDDVGDAYDRSKALPAGAYDRLRQSIKRLRNLGMRVSIRIHYHPELGLDPCYRITEDLKEFKNVSMYARIVYGEEKPELYEDLLKFEEHLISLHMMRPGFPYHTSGTHCMADRRTHATIGPDGDLSPCEHYAYGEEMYGTILSRNISGPILAKWQERTKHSLELCQTCPLFPMCEKITACPAEGDCEKGYQQYQIERIRRALRNAAAATVTARPQKTVKANPPVCGVC